MSRHVALPAAIVGCAVLIQAFLERSQADNGIILRAGTVLSAGDEKLTIRDDRDDEQKHSFIVPSGTYVTLNGKEVALEALKPGYFARVSARRSSDRPVARAIEAGAAISHVSDRPRLPPTGGDEIDGAGDPSRDAGSPCVPSMSDSLRGEAARLPLSRWLRTCPHLCETRTTTPSSLGPARDFRNACNCSRSSAVSMK